MACSREVFLVTSLASLLGARGEVFTTNAICLRSNCINPIFPGLEDLHRLEEAYWTASTRSKVSKAISFCRNAVNYDPALPTSEELDFDAMVRKQDAAATTMFMYHLAGMGLEAFNYPKPEFADNCVKSVWRMVCFTYFPRAPIGSQEGAPTPYIRPCQSSCQNYLRMCGVECCDESVKCVFTHEKATSPTMSFTQTGYIPHDGPSSLCTGAAHGRSPSLLVWALLLWQGLGFFEPFRGAGALGRSRTLWLAVACGVASAVLLQGCNVDVPTHEVGNWRAETDYLVTFEFVPPGMSSRNALLNSCSLPQLSQTVQCGGRGVCRTWDEANLELSPSFCFCDRDWADPECSTKRQSQIVAYTLAVFLGWSGADQFYLGFPISGTLKLCSLGGFGVWWIVDIIRMGSAPVDTHNFKVSSDLPHWAFVLCTVTLTLLIGFGVANVLLVQHVQKRRKDALMMQSNEEHRLIAAKGRTDRVAGDNAAMEKFASAQRFLPDYGSTHSAGDGAAQGEGGQPVWWREKV